MNENNEMVYLYGFSLRQRDKSESLLKIFNEHVKQKTKITLILLHDGVIGITQKSKIPPVLEELLHTPVTIYALISDILARGMDLKDLRNQIKAIDYDDLVDNLVDSEKIVSWI
ncbi:MAG: sulfurtransferase complex subunit TusB [Candidatus Lokiarchaeota archaeon]|nr:sulfurtransferase complex subunit TusB [Candidatus Lokiarchaeota archaeon]